MLGKDLSPEINISWASCFPWYLKILALKTFLLSHIKLLSEGIQLSLSINIFVLLLINLFKTYSQRVIHWDGTGEDAMQGN